LNAALHFSQTYAEARRQFFDATRPLQLQVESHIHPLRGRDGEELAMDVARLGPADAKGLLLFSSACHGVEGFCGSGAQVALLRDAAWVDEVQRSGCAVLFIHALNPHGFSHGRRVTHEGVDLNRNWHDFSQALPENPSYDELASAIVPDTWPEPAQAQQRLTAFGAAHGARALQAALSGGQYRHPQGIFYGGTAPTWSQRSLRRVLQSHGTRCKRLGWIDLHTGLGPSGHGERIFADKDDKASLQRARAWWGPDVTSIYDSSSSSSLLKGLMWQAVAWDCPQAEYTGIALEYGTLPMEDVMQALRADHWLHAHPAQGQAQAAAIRRQMRRAFYTDTDDWKERIVAQAQDAVRQALKGLIQPA
jgi:Protein of unknown function (DUF2817)